MLGCGSGCSLCASCPCCASLPHASGPVVLSSPSLVLPVSTPRAVAHGSGSGCCCAGRHGCRSSTVRSAVTWRGNGGCGVRTWWVSPCRGLPAPFIHRLPFVHCPLSFVLCHCPLSFVVHPLLFVLHPLLFVVCCSLFVVRRSLSIFRGAVVFGSGPPCVGSCRWSHFII